MRRLQLTALIIAFRDPLLGTPFTRWCIIVATALNLGAWVVILGIPNLPGTDAIIIHYTTTFGIDALGNWRDLLRLPVTGTVLLGANIAIARLLATGSDAPRSAPPSPAARILVAASVPIEFAVLLGTILLWNINGGSLNGSNGF
ncbi:hypothetical protein HY635_02500 [Candidatus Uhrbacteria bacterium]|nr:hypothetical protein [Candidatus Uhrbacteria bacterium]